MQNKLRFIFIPDLLICLQMLQMIFFIGKYKVKSTLSYAFLAVFSHVFPYAFLFPRSFPTVDFGLVAIIFFVTSPGDSNKQYGQLGKPKEETEEEDRRRRRRRSRVPRWRWPERPRRWTVDSKDSGFPIRPRVLCTYMRYA